MEYFVQFAYIKALYVFVPTVFLLSWYKLKKHKGARYRYPLASTLKKNNVITRHPHKKILFFMRFITLLGLALLIGKPQLVDPRSMMNVEGIDIVLVLDISDSMNLPHHADDKRSRIDVAKQEAIYFVEKRTNDAIGVVVFGNEAFSRCPLTVDKQMLKEIISDVHIGMVDRNGTLLSTSVVTAANRLKRSKAASKVMILLTDGEPSENDSDPRNAIEIAKQLDIRIYTIGIGSDQEIWIQHPLYGPVAVKTTLNKKLLTTMANETGGRFFEAKNATDMRLIYDTIDKLEKTEIESPVFTKRYDTFIPFVLFILAMILLELLLSSVVWFGV